MNRKKRQILDYRGGKVNAVTWFYLSVVENVGVVSKMEADLRKGRGLIELNDWTILHTSQREVCHFKVRSSYDTLIKNDQKETCRDKLKKYRVNLHFMPTLTKRTGQIWHPASSLLWCWCTHYTITLYMNTKQDKTMSSVGKTNSTNARGQCSHRHLMHWSWFVSRGQRETNTVLPDRSRSISLYQHIKSEPYSVYEQL